MSYYYGDLKAGLKEVRKQFSYLRVEELNELQHKYSNRWLRFYGLNNKYQANGKLRGG